ncbi:MAG: amidohydrolase family protein, partial [Acidobacteria bacterium]|nr:amidohydrolase family protein [Acidobacteriota bacterium]
MKRRAVIIVALALMTSACGTSSPQPPAATEGAVADLLIMNGRPYLGEGLGTGTQAVALSGNTILRVGTDAELAALRGPRTQVIDARGGTVAPGFNDSHVHFVDGGLALGDVDLAGLTTLLQVQDRIRAFAAANPANA